MKVRLRDRLVYVLGRAAIGTAALLPGWLGYGAAFGLGRLYFACAPRRRRYALRQLRNAFPGRADRELLRIGARSTGNLFKVPLDMAKATRAIARGEVLRYCEVSPAQVPKPPLLGVTAHLGSWEMAAVSVAAMYTRTHVVVRIFKNPLLQRWLLASRARAGLVIHPRRGGIRDLARALEQGAVALQAVDQNQRLRGVFAPWFGELASTERAAVSLALRKGYPIVVARCERVGGGFRFRLVHDAPFLPVVTGDRAVDVLAAVTEVSRRIEQHVLACPEQYLWIHDRYRTQPAPGAGAVDLDDPEDEPPDPDDHPPAQRPGGP